MCRPKNGTEFGTFHELSNRHANHKTKVFEWTRHGWSTPNTGFSTPPGAMAALGWAYNKEVEFK